MIYYALLLHFIFDFILQSDYMALNKSKSSGVLALHSAIYALLALCFIPDIRAYVPSFAIWLFITHFGIDFATSRATAWLWSRNKRHWFFVTIGFDQFLHTSLMLWWLSNIPR